MKQARLLFLLIVVVFIYPNQLLAQDHLSEEIQAIVDQLSLKLNANAGTGNLAKTITVADFTNLNGIPTELGKYLSEEFLFSLSNVKSSYTVIDRSRVNALLKEAGLEVKGLLDPEASAKLGKLKSIDVIIVGTLTEDGNDIRVSVKAIKLESAAVVAVARGQISMTPAITKLQNNELTDNGSTSAKKTYAESTTPGSKTDAGVAQQRIEMMGCSFELLECRQVGQDITCKMRIKSTGKDIDFEIAPSLSRILDSKNGYETIALSAKLADKSVLNDGNWIKKSLVADTPIDASITFSGVSGRVEKLSKMELQMYIDNRFFVTFRNIAVQQ